MSKPSLVLKRRPRAPPETVYQAWTQPEQMTLWWGNPHHKTKKPIAETDLRVGGRFRVQFWSQDDEHHSVSRVYREVVPNRRLIAKGLARGTGFDCVPAAMGQSGSR